LGLYFITDNEGSLGGSWDSKEDTVYFSAVHSTINTNDTVTEVFKLDVSSITGGLVKATQQSLTPKLLKISSHPNPFSRVTNIEYSVPKEGYVAINIYSANGDLIKVLGQEKENQGLHHRMWDGKDNGGKPIADGIYYYQVISGDFISVKQLIKFR
jgi:flagellar hook assembly protein FlgD